MTHHEASISGQAAASGFLNLSDGCTEFPAAEAEVGPGKLVVAAPNLQFQYQHQLQQTCNSSTSMYQHQHQYHQTCNSCTKETVQCELLQLSEEEKHKSDEQWKYFCSPASWESTHFLEVCGCVVKQPSNSPDGAK